jgi:hypothetical protein
MNAIVMGSVWCAASKMQQASSCVDVCACQQTSTYHFAADPQQNEGSMHPEDETKEVL